MREPPFEDAPYWPGPDADMTWDEIIMSFTRTRSAAMHEAMREMYERMTRVGEGIAKVAETLEPVLIEAAAPPKKSVGPRRGSQFDHRGRRRW